MSTIIILLVLGVLLLVIDIAFVPGMILGIFGAILILTAVITAYLKEGELTGHITLASAVFASAIILYWFFKTDVWSRFALNNTNEGKVNEEQSKLVTGMEGTTISALRPSGKAEFEGKPIEVSCLNGYCQPGKKIIIVKLEGSRIWVVEKEG